MNTRARIDGQALARTGAVTLDTNPIDATGCVLGLSKTFSPSTIERDSNSTLTFTFFNTSVTPTTLKSAFIDDLPYGVVIAATPNVVTTCGGTGVLTATPGSSSVSMSAGWVVPGGSTGIPGTCILSVAITGEGVGSFTNTIPAYSGHLSAEATLTVLRKPTTPKILPGTGFAPGVKTILSKQPADKAYVSLGDLWLEIPRLNAQMPIMGVPVSANGWDVTWLSDQAGWLQGTAFPTWAGNSVLTGHVYDVNGKVGPFGKLNSLVYGDRIIVHAWGQQYIYEVRSTSTVTPNSVASVIRHEELPWISLLTCKGYIEKTNSYKDRYLIRAVQVAVK